MRTLNHYRSKIAFWNTWLESEHKPNHQATATKLLAMYEAILPEAEAYWDRVRSIQTPQEEVPCEGPGCTNTFKPSGRKKTCSDTCRKALFDRRRRQTRP